MTALKHDSNKPDCSLLPAVSVLAIAQVLTFGKQKYAAHNWRKGVANSRYIAACLRHLFAYLGGESVDKESGLSHLAHAGCCILFLIEQDALRPELDDRWKP